MPEAHQLRQTPQPRRLMALVTGYLNDFGLQPIAFAKAPEIWFVPSGPATSGITIFGTDPIKADLAQTGAWAAELADTESMNQVVWYTVQIRWLDSAAMYSQIDYPDWKVFVPASGGKLPALIAGYSQNPLILFWQPTTPDPWPLGATWVNTLNGDVNRRDA